MSSEDSSDEDIPGLESVSSSEYVDDSDSGVPDSSDEDDAAPVLPSSVDPTSPNYITAKRWLEQNHDSINRHLDIIAVYMFSPFLYGHAHQTDKWLGWCQEVGLLLSDIDFNTGELSETERNAVDVLDKAMEYCRDSMKESLLPDQLSMLLQVSEKVNSMSTIKEAVRAARKREWFMVMLQTFDGREGGVTNESIRKMNFVEIGCLYAINQTAEHVLKYVKDGYSYVSEFEEDCAADDKVCDIHCLTVFDSCDWVRFRAIGF